MNKSEILKQVIEKVREELGRQVQANETASQGATNSEARAETKWDTCGLEQSYLARGHAQQFQELIGQYEELKSFKPADFTGKPIGVGAVITVKIDGNTMHFFLLKGGGGIEVNYDGKEISVITPESPVGAALLDKKQGDSDEDFIRAAI